MIDRMKTRGERLKARRLELKMTLKQVAQSVGISFRRPKLRTWRRNAVAGDRACPGEMPAQTCAMDTFGTESDPDRVPVIGTTESGPDSDWQPENLPTQNDSCHLLANGKPFMRSLSGTRFSTTISRVTSSWLTQLLRQFRVKMC